ncbi:MAG: ZTL protein [Verrucomicrobiae bacterium]|nr:ZTL protein [Verrucomicrobiae bacterium]
MAEATIYVLAGVNGSGKSSLGGAAIEKRGVVYYNPDLAAQTLRGIHPGMTPFIANSHAWTLGKEMLEKAITKKETFAFETTLGGNTITGLLYQATEKGLMVKMWYIGLKSVESNLARVRARVARGEHNIPEADIRKRWDSSRRNLIKLLPSLHSLRLYDNSHESDPHTGKAPKPRLLLHVEAGKIIGPDDLSDAPEWSKPIIAGALNTFGNKPSI